MASAQFWKDRQAEFERYAVQYSDLKAYWKGDLGRWKLWWGSTTSGRDIPQECEGVFDAIARKATTALPNSDATGDGRPWSRWVDFMRARNWGFRVTASAWCSELEWDTGVKDGRPLADVRLQLKILTSPVQLDHCYERTKDGSLRLLTKREVRKTRGDDLRKYFRWIDDGVIESVFGSSVRFCEALAAEAFALEVRRGAGVGGDTVSDSAQPVSKLPTKGRKRGPPTDYENAARVAAVVARIAPEGDWRQNLDEVCDALDGKGIEADAIPFPKPWRAKHKAKGWADYPEKHICVKAIQKRLKLAEEWKRINAETFS